MGYWNPERKVGVEGHFFEVIKQRLSKRSSEIQSNVWRFFFFQIEALLYMKNAWLPPIFFWIPKALSKFCFLRIVLNCTKISLY